MVSSATLTKLIPLILVLGIACARPQTEKNSLPLQVAKAYGLDSFSLVGKMKYTFNVKFNGKTISRSWLWDVSGGRVTMQVPGAVPVSYARSGSPDTSKENVRKADAQFINDQYWLLFPLHLVWDASAAITVALDRPVPIGTGAATMVTITYPSAGGYTPGDAFDLFVDKGNHVKQWVFRRGNATVPTRTNLWEENRRVGPLLLSLNRPGADSTFRVWFTDVAVQLKGSTDWLLPQ
ncbi:MAG TPA: hypothetical protein VKF42_11530 [Chitinivibrionales bacterium]|jgi:hypothetical protein|nr:hypothetical protein [Chitinivibrionales bacterium]